MSQGNDATARGDTEETRTSPEFVRGVYASVVDWYKSAESKAQLILTLDGIFLAFVVSVLVGSTELLRRVHGLTALLLLLMVLSVGVSISFGIACVWSRIYRSNKLLEIFKREGVNVDDYETYRPAVCWFFQTVTELKQGEFTKRMKEISPSFEVEALAREVFVLSGNVRKKHRYVNVSFLFAGAALFFYALSALTIVLRQRDLL